MKCTVKWYDGMSFIAETGSGHLMAMDVAPESGGRNFGPRPMELLLAGTGGCSSFDVVQELKRDGFAISGCETIVEATRADTAPKVFTQIHFHFIVSGSNLKPEALESAIKFSVEKNGSALIMLSKTARISFDWEIIET